MSILIQHAHIINEGKRYEADVFIKNGLIHQIGPNLHVIADQKIDASGLLLMPGMIDDQVHFREPGLTHKTDIQTASRAAVAGGTTSFMEMPNTKPQTLTQALLQAKYDRAAAVSPANYSFFMGASNDNLEHVLQTDPQQVCGVKVFMGSSTGNMLVDDTQVLERIFKEVPMLIATHCEKEEVVRANMAQAIAQYGDNIPVTEHPLIRSREACLRSSSQAVALAKKYNTRLHILHISTADELALFRNDIPLEEKRITAEACIHHLWFTDADYERLGVRIKWNPAVKTAEDRAAIRAAVKDGRIDVIATDHAPHTWEEKSNPYTSCPSGAPLVQHAMVALLEMVEQGVFSYEEVAQKAAHNVARCFQIEKRGYIREGYFADVVLVDPQAAWTVSKENIMYKCGWSPLEGQRFSHSIHSTIVSGKLAYHQGKVDNNTRGQRMLFRQN